MDESPTESQGKPPGQPPAAGGPARREAASVVPPRRPSPAPLAPPVEAATSDLNSQLGELLGVTRELLRVSRAQLEVNLRWEQRMVEQQQSQRDELAQLLRDQPQLRGRSRRMAELTRTAMGKAVSDLFDFLDQSGDDLGDSEFVSREMGDRFGQLLGQISNLHFMLRRLAAADRPEGEKAGGK